MTNLVVVTIDCFRYDRCGFNGHSRPTTPTLDALASESIVFDQAYATGPYTTESFPGIIAGHHSYNGLYYGEKPAWKALAPNSETIATYLQKHGYDTVGTVTNPHLTTSRNFDRGFDSYRNLQTQGEDPSDRTDETDEGLWAKRYSIRERMRGHSSRVNPYTVPYLGLRYSQLRSGWPTVSGRSVMDAFKADLREADPPFFGWTHLMDLHAPLHPRRVAEGELAATDSVLRQFVWDAARVALIHEPRYNSLYDSALRYLDHQLSEFITFLKAIEVWDDTALVVTGDHGEVLFDRYDLYGHPRHHLYDESLRVPLLVRLPTGEQARVDTAFSLAWIHELVSEIVGAPRGAFPSESGTQWLSEGPSQETPPVVSDTLDGTGHTIAVRNAEAKVIHHQGTGDSSGIEYEYQETPVQFAYRSDPGERDPTVDVCPDLLSTANEFLTAPNEIPSIGEGFSKAREQQLADLGYRL